MRTLKLTLISTLLILIAAHVAGAGSAFVFEGSLVSRPVVSERGPAGNPVAYTFLFSTGDAGAWTLTCRRPHLSPCFQLPIDGSNARIVLTGVAKHVYDSASGETRVEFQLR